MPFFELTHPTYNTDAEEAAANPVRVVAEIVIPGIICPVCGPWAGSRRPYFQVDDVALRRRLVPDPLPLEEWRDLARSVRLAVALPDTTALWPGDILGSPTIELLTPNIPDFLHPFPGQILVTSEVVRALSEQSFTGYRAIKAMVQSSSEWRSPSAMPELFELLIQGEAWSQGQDRRTISVCMECGRTSPGYTLPAAIDEAGWDGSDFFIVNSNPNAVFITERVRNAIQEGRFSNVAFLS